MERRAENQRVSGRGLSMAWKPCVLLFLLVLHTIGLAEELPLTVFDLKVGDGHHEPLLLIGIGADDSFVLSGQLSDQIQNILIGARSWYLDRLAGKLNHVSMLSLSEYEMGGYEDFFDGRSSFVLVVRGRYHELLQEFVVNGSMNPKRVQAMLRVSKISHSLPDLPAALRVKSEYGLEVLRRDHQEQLVELKALAVDPKNGFDFIPLLFHTAEELSMTALSGLTEKIHRPGRRLNLGHPNIFPEEVHDLYSVEGSPEVYGQNTDQVRQYHSLGDMGFRCLPAKGYVISYGAPKDKLTFDASGRPIKGGLLSYYQKLGFNPPFLYYPVPTWPGHINFLSDMSREGWLELLREVYSRRRWRLQGPIDSVPQPLASYNEASGADSCDAALDPNTAKR